MNTFRVVYKVTEWDTLETIRKQLPMVWQIQRTTKYVDDQGREYTSLDHGLWDIRELGK